MPGDSLYAIARKYNTTVDELKKINNLSTTLLSIGQVLRLPINQQTENTYVVKSGDSLYSIAKKYNISVNELKEANNLTSNLLSIGQVLKIPTGDNIVENNTDEITYIVQKGDNLYAIAKKYNTTQDAIMNYNNLTSNLLSIGQILKIPRDDNQITYIVKSGDNLYNIASRYNTTVDEIKKKNNLTSNVLQIGQKLII